MSTKLMTLLALCTFAVQASDKTEAERLRDCQQLILRLGLPKIGGEQTVTRPNFAVAVEKASQRPDEDFIKITLRGLIPETMGFTRMHAFELRSMKSREYAAEWQRSNARENLYNAQAREIFSLLNNLYDAMPIQEQQQGTLSFKKINMCLPVSDDARAVENPRKRRLDFGASDSAEKKTA